MNIEKVEVAKKIFFDMYPGGFDDERMAEIKKKHKIGKMHELTKETLSKELFNNVKDILDSWVKIVTRSSMVSVFEKPKFRDLIKVLSPEEKEILANGLKEFLYGNREFGFQSMVDILSYYKLAKWTILTVAAYYLKPQDEVFIKPTTTKAAINFFEMDCIKYSSKPTYKFYSSYKEEFIKLKNIVGLTNDNAAFGGFIMITALGNL